MLALSEATNTAVLAVKPSHPAIGTQSMEHRMVTARWDHAVRSIESSPTVQQTGLASDESVISSHFSPCSPRRYRPPAWTNTIHTLSQDLHRSTAPGESGFMYRCWPPICAIAPQAAHAPRAELMSSTNTSRNIPAAALPSNLN